VAVERVGLREREGNVQLHRYGVEESVRGGVACLTRAGATPPLFTFIHQENYDSDSSFPLIFNVLPNHPKPRSVLSLSFPPSTLMSSFSASPSITTSPPSSPHDLRHIISTGALTPQKDAVRERKLSAYASQHLGLRVGSRSPTSIPSSPTSVYVILIISPLNPPRWQFVFFFSSSRSIFMSCRFLTIPLPVLL
jgi:hypothetical protein